MDSEYVNRNRLNRLATKRGDFFSHFAIAACEILIVHINFVYGLYSRRARKVTTRSEIENVLLIQSSALSLQLKPVGDASNV